ncbi:MAG: hypothetical protein WDO68_25425 [Gammaproteobacteria bacterium]
MEYTAEDLVSHRLQRVGVLVAKPKFDQLGTDLIGLVGVTDNAKFCRIQCKGRSLLNSPTARVEIPRGYASDAFVAFLYVDTGNPTETHLFCFTGDDIRKWKGDAENYCLNISRSTFVTELAAFSFTEQRAALVKKLIIGVGAVGQFNTANYGYVESSLGGISASLSGTFKPKSDT